MLGWEYIHAAVDLLVFSFCEFGAVIVPSRLMSVRNTMDLFLNL